MKENTYFVVQSWMSDMGLKGNDLIIYAIIYGFSQDGESRFTGSLQYLADWCNSTKAGIQKNLKNLIDMGLIEKYESFKNNIKFCEYSCTPYNKVAYPMQQSCINNINNNIEKNTKIINDFSSTQVQDIKDDFEAHTYSKEELRNEFLGSAKKSTRRRNVIRKPTLFDKCVAEIDAYTDRPDLREKLIQFLKIRLEVKDKPFGIETWKGLLDKLEQIARSTCIDYVVLVQQSIDKGWLSFYPINERPKTDKKESVFCDIDMPNTADIKVDSKEVKLSGKVF